MEPVFKNLGKVRPTVDNNNWSIDNEYDLLTIVYDPSSNKSYISRQPVPANVVIDNREYWLPFGVGKFVDNAIININYLDGVSEELVTYTLEEAIARIGDEDKRLGVIISFYGNESNDSHTPGWCLYQFMSSDLNDWDNVDAWNSIYYNRNKNVGWFRTESDLLLIYPNPHKGDYCYIGTSLLGSFVYRCYENGTWVNTNELASANIGIIIDGTITISQNGTWIIDGKDTGIKAVGTGIDRITYTASSEDGGTNILQIKLTDGTQYSFPIKNGNQGNSGIIVPDLETFLAELVNNLTTDDGTKALSAAQGVVLNNKISQLGQYINNDEWLYVVTDSNGRILFGLKTDGGFYIYKAAFLDMLNRLNISALEGITLFNNEEWLNVETDKNGNLLSGTKTDGSHYIRNVKSETIPDFRYIDNHEWLLALLEARNRLLCGIKKDGTFETKKIDTKELCVSSDNGLYNFLTIASKNKYNKEILSLHPETEIVPILRNYKFWGYQYNNTHPDYKPLTLLWFTDLHKDSDNLSRILKFFSTYKSSGIDDVIFTGDATDDYTDDISFWEQNGGKNILFCVGNHEVCIGSTFVSSKQVYDKYLAPNIENWNIETNENKCYWYKDYSFPYSEECPSGIRIISLDMYHWKETTNYDGTPLSGDSYADGTPYDTGEQESWFIDVLNDAKDNGFAVIVLVHGPKNDIDELSCSFNTLDKITLNKRECFKDDMLQDVANFIEAGGEFVCWLCGHTHQDWFGTIEGQPLIVAGTSSHITKWRGDDMVVGTKSQDRFNLISIEPVKKYIRIHRVGLEYDRHGRYINEIVYDYKNKSLISNL